MGWHARAADGRHQAHRTRTRARVLVVALVVALTTAGLGTPAAAGSDAPHGHGVRPGTRTPNLPPATPADVGTVEPVTSCTPRRAPSPVRSLTPTLTATLADPEARAVRGVFAVHDARSGRRVWGPVATTDQASGARHTVTVPAGVLVDGRSYEWRVTARDDRWRESRTVRCGVTVDVTAPGVPVVTAQAGAAAVYLEDGVAGGIAIPGQFRLEGAGDPDVVAFLYTVNGAPARVAVDAGTTGASVTFVPTSSGSQQLSVQAVDAAGNVGPERFYRFSVAGAPLGAAWLLDEGAGDLAADTGGVHPLTLHGSTGWGAGPLSELGVDPADGALALRAAGDTATTAGPVVAAGSSFSVLAFARLDGTGSTATVVSQDGAADAGFTLGQRASGDCPDGLASCWAFTVADGDGAPGGAHAPVSVATSSLPVRAGSWVLLAGVHDAVAGTVRLDVCEVGIPGEPDAGSLRPVPGTAVPTVGAWTGSGPLRLGGAVRDGSLDEAWVGSIGSVSARAGVIGQSTVLRACGRGIA